MPNSYRSTDEVVAQCLSDNKNVHLNFSQMKLFASGAFSNVYSGLARTDSSHEMPIVIKKTWPRNKDSLLEVEILRRLGTLKHKNVVRLLYSYTRKHEARVCLSLIFEYVPLNLHQFLKDNNRRLDILEVKMITWQLFRGQSHLQKSRICHRDIKPQNLLFNADTGLLKISDFGSSCIQSSSTPLASYHVTRYYRPPELLLGAKFYSCEVDVWSCGCVFGELLKGGIFLAGKSATNQAEIVFDALGCPTKEDLTAMQASSSKHQEIKTGYEPDPARKTLNFSFMYDHAVNTQRDRRTFVYNNKINQRDMRESVDLIRQILVYHPERRLSGIDFLTHVFFNELFAPNAIRSNGRRILCLSQADLQAVRSGDGTVSLDSTDGEGL
ncbi:hypothetical protein CAEBREN_08117 [Caenorhabditis brenneri]|uniref:Protein kinase domain-containing protein n=1 Tax=Caenorhabditis brenneri TaxID=135651 RepID=G0MGG3_CAEBE|nr:hypothetical protein CAEBREN_08117 [Caenorhabditis brenneri]